MQELSRINRVIQNHKLAEELVAEADATSDATTRERIKLIAKACRANAQRLKAQARADQPRLSIDRPILPTRMFNPDDFGTN
jgi:hypothetical protein